jgi:hypothetical protein
MWYQLQIQVTTGSRHYDAGGFATIDWGYLAGSEQVPSSLQAEPVKWATNTLKTFMEHDMGVGPQSDNFGWNYRDNQAGFLDISNPSARVGNWDVLPNGTQIIESMYQFAFEKNASFDNSAWQFAQSSTQNSYAGVNLPPANYILGSGSFPVGGAKDDDINRSFADQTAMSILVLKNTYQVKSALLAGITAWMQMMWPDNNWSAYRNPASNGVSAPSGVSATSNAPEQVQVSWTPVKGATSYNVKRAGTDGVFLTVAYFVPGPAYTDRGLHGANVYQYKVSANFSADAQESLDSSVVSVITQTGLVAQWEPQMVSPSPQALVADQSQTQVNMNWYQTWDEEYYLNSPVNLSRWVGGTNTISVWVNWNSALAASEGNNVKASVAVDALGLVGSNNDVNASSFMSGLIRQADATHFELGGLWNNCSFTSVSGGSLIWSNPFANFGDGNSHLVTVTRDATVGTVNFYIDGQSVGSGTSGVGVCSGTAFSFGKVERSSLAHPAIPGTMCDARIYDTALSAAQVQSLFNSTLALCK